MTDQPKKKSRMWEFLLIFALVYLASDMAVRYFFPKATPAEEQRQVELVPESSSFRIGHAPALTLNNNSTKIFTFEDRCPMPPMDVYAVEGTGGALTALRTTVTAIPCAAFPAVGSGSEATIGLAPWKYSLFEKPGTYEVHLLNTAGGNEGSGAILTTRFSVHEPGTIVKLFRTFITKPFLNFLIFIAAALPNHSLAIGIIILTLLVKLILFLPTQHSMEGQRKMQLLQPKIEELKKRLKDQPQKLHEETMLLWKQEKVNPFQSCLPILLQFPILIGLFYVIRDGSNLALSREFIYPMYQHLSWNFNPSFFGLDLTQTNWIFPPVLVILQYLQMKLSFATASKKQTTPVDPSQKLQQTMMTYTLPFMIGFFALNFPGAVSLYWGVSTVFAIGQQMIVNREKIKV